MFKEALASSLPVSAEGLVLRHWTRRDLDHLSLWPPYPVPYERFDLGYRNSSGEERDKAYVERDSIPDRVTLVADYEGHKAIALIALTEIDWDAPSIGNMGFRLSAAWCDRGIGTRTMKLVTTWCYAQGIKRVRFDVAGSNARALRCYERAGFAVTGEFWRDDPFLVELGHLDKPEYAFMLPHVRFVNGTPQLRFYWMERRAEEE